MRYLRRMKFIYFSNKKILKLKVLNYPNIQNVTDEEEFLEITCKCWSKFYSMLLQYDYDACLPLGIFVDDAKDLRILIRKAITTFFKRIIYFNKFFIQQNSISSFLPADLSEIYELPDCGDNLRNCFRRSLNSKLN